MQNLAKDLLIWYAEHKRRLPWRDVADPYHTWLSEIMLQQTRVEAVKRYYERFLDRLPTIEALAAAEEDVYLKLWEGLGYYSRVRNLNKAAGQIMKEFGGKMPGTYDEIITIAGIGPYTGAAIASIAFGEMRPAIDGNLLRIFSRLTKYGEDIKSTVARQKAHEFFLDMMRCLDEYMPDCESVLKTGNPYGDLNQALMDLGATICTPNGKPQCGICPLQCACLANLSDTAMDYPVAAKKKARSIEKITVFIIRDSGMIALSKRKAKGLLAGMYEFPNVDGHLSPDEAVKTVKGFGFQPLIVRSLGESKHIFSHKEWHMIGYEMIVDELEPRVRTHTALSGYDGTDELRGEQIHDMETTYETKHSKIFLARIAQIEEQYSIPSAFSFYRDKL